MLKEVCFCFAKLHNQCISRNILHAKYQELDIMTGAGNAYPSGVPNCPSSFFRGLCCPVICISVFHFIVLSFGFSVLIVPLVWLLGIYMLYYYRHCGWCSFGCSWSSIFLKNVYRY